MYTYAYNKPDPGCSTRPASFPWNRVIGGGIKLVGGVLEAGARQSQAEVAATSWNGSRRPVAGGAGSPVQPASTVAYSGDPAAPQRRGDQLPSPARDCKAAGVSKTKGRPHRRPGNLHGRFRWRRGAGPRRVTTGRRSTGLKAGSDEPRSPARLHQLVAAQA